MTYNKPSNLSYTDMAIWIDTNAYSESCDDYLLYEYLYHLAVMLAHQHKYFNKNDYYDEFGLYSASKLFMRLRNPKQFTSEAESSRGMYQIKSILNYIKTVIYPYKVDFEQEFYLNCPEDESVLYAGNQELCMYIADESDMHSRIDFEFSIDNIYNLCRSFLYKIPCRANSYEWHNIYCSCMLTLLDSITPVNSDKGLYDPQKLDHEQIMTLLKSLDKDPILYHLDAHMSNYIKVLVRELRHFISQQLTLETSSYIDSESSTKSMIIAALQEED